MKLPSASIRRVAAMGVVVAAAWLPYRGVLINSFVHDDYMWLAMAEKARVEPWILLALRPFSPNESLGQFTPATQAFFSGLYAVCGKNALCYYMLALALHTANAIAVFLFAGRLGMSTLMRGLVAGLFAVQFQSCHAVLYLSEFAPVALNLLILGVLWQYDVFLRERRRGGYAGAIAFFLASMAWHAASVIILPLMLIHKVLLCGPRRERFCAREFVHLAPFGALLIPYLVFLLSDPAAKSEIYGLGFHCVLIMIRTIVAMFFPAEVVPFWPALAVVGVVAALLPVVCPWVRAQVRLCAYGLAWTAIALLPWSFFFWSGVQLSCSPAHSKGRVVLPSAFSE